MARHRLTAVLVATLALCLLAGGSGAFLLGQHRAEIEAAAATTGGSTGSDTPPASSGTDTTAGRPSRDSRSAEPRSVDTATADPGGDSPPVAPGQKPTFDGPPEPASSMAPQARPAKDRAVRLSAAAEQDPQAGDIRDLLQRHFDAINTGDYKLWAGTVTPDQVKAIPPDRWRKEYSTTIDTGMIVEQIDPNSGQVVLQFRSRQAPEFAPDRTSRCVDWKVSLPVVTVDHTVLIGRSLEDRAKFAPC